MSYTAQLFESLLRASAEGSGGPPPAPPSHPASESSAAPSELPHELDECYAVIKFQRNQIAQLRGRVASLEEQNAELREAAASAHANVSSATAAASRVMSDELAALRTTMQQQTEEIKKLRDERAALARQVAEAEAKVHSVRAAADREKQELAFKLGREAAFANLPASNAAVHASPFTTAPTESSENLESALAAAATPQANKKAAGEAASALTSEDNDAAAGATSGSASSPSTLTNTAGTITASGVSSSAALDASTASLLEKQEQIKQQEALLLALKQQQVVNRVLTAQQRLQQQRMQQGSLASMGSMANMGGMAGMQGGMQGMGSPAQSFRMQQQGGMGMGMGMGPMGAMGSPSGILPRHGTQMNLGGPMGGGWGQQQQPQPMGMHRSMTAMPMGPYGHMQQPQGMQPPMSPYGGGPAGSGLMPVGSQRRLSPSASSMSMSAGGNRRRQVASRAAAAVPREDPYGAYGDEGIEDGSDYGASEMYPPHPQSPSKAGLPSAGGKGDAAGAVAVGFGPDGQPQVLPDADSPVEMKEMEFAPPGGYTLYRYPAAGSGKWPEYMLFFRPLVNNGVPILKHGRMGRPHPRLMWLDISDPDKPTLVWHEGNARDPAKVKEKDRLPLIDIIDIKAGRVSPNLQRSGNEKDAGRYMSFNADGRTFDIELPTPECRDWLFKKFADLFQAYANAKMSGLVGDQVTELVLAQIDGTGMPPGPSEQEVAAAAGAARTPGGRGRGASPRRAASARQMGSTPSGAGTGAGGGAAGGGGGRQRSRSPRGMTPAQSMYY